MEYPLRYRVKFPRLVTPMECELKLFEKNHPIEKGGLGRKGHLMKFIEMMFPGCESMHNEWTDIQLESCCDYDYIGWAGCGSCGKTHIATLYAMAWWAVAPTKSAVIMTSTTKAMIRKRQWAALQYWIKKSKGRFPGHMVDSKTILQATAGDDKHGIYSVAVNDGNTSEAASNIQGIHCERMLVIVDEATDTPEAIWEVVTNLRKGCPRFQMIVIGNPNSYFDPHGRFCEPKTGWNSITVDWERWETKQGVCIHFDGLKSPNIKAGEDKWPYLIKGKEVEYSRMNEGENSPSFWKYTRGFWCPTGSTSRVLTEALCAKFNVMNSEPIYQDYTVIGGLDPAFGGDNCKLKLAKLGDRPDGTKFVHFFLDYTCKIDVLDKDPITFQIAKQVKQVCEENGCKPEHLAVDTTGNGAGCADVISREWSPNIIRVCFSTSPSDMPVSDTNKRKSSDAYKNKVTELWMSVRRFVEADKIRGLDPQTIKEFCNRNVTDEERKQVVESKKDMKERMRFSPDSADAASLVIEVARLLGASNATLKSNEAWDKVASMNNRIYENNYVDAA